MVHMTTASYMNKRILTYLDTYNLILLSDLKYYDPWRFNIFVSKWKKKGHVLALSNTHLFEFLRADDPDTRTRHFEMLVRFLPLRFEVDNFSKREIILTLIKKGNLRPGKPEDVASYEMFSLELKRKKDLSPLLDSAHAAVETGSYDLFILFNEFFWKFMLRNAVNMTAKQRLPDIQNSRMEKLRAKILSKFIGMDLTAKENQNKTFEAFWEDYAFRCQVKATAKAFAGKFHRSITEIFLNSINLRDCKGLWLRNEVRKNLIQSGPKIEKAHNNEQDLNNIQYLPYVDILVTDRAMVGFTEQTLRRKSLPESLKSISNPRKAANNIDALEKILFDFNSEKREHT